MDVLKLLKDVFDPQQGEVATIVVDLPHDEIVDNPRWQERREMAENWRQALSELGVERKFVVNAMLHYPATGGNNADLPKTGILEGSEVDLEETLKASTLVIAMTEYSATAPLSNIADAHEDFRAASMPGVALRMQETALSVDHSAVARRCKWVDEALDGGVLVDVVFSTGHRCFFDIRHREAEMDDGFLPRFKKGDRIINLPSGETFVVPYEGEIEHVPSQTAGTIPVIESGELVLFQVVGNRVRFVDGKGPVAERYNAFFDEDPARANIAEVAFGVNDCAQVTGSVIEDEKAGFHWAFGRSDHLGGIFGVDKFKSPETVVHQDIVYAEGNPVQVASALVVHEDGRKVEIIKNGAYVFD